MAIKKIFRAINTKGTPWDSPEDIEFLIYEDEDGNTSVALDGQTLNAEKISQIGGGTTVVANPAGEATVALTKIQIGNVIYSIEGSSAELDKLLNEEF